MSSVTNFAIGVVVARLAMPREFGIFSLAFTLYVTLLWVSRSVTTDPFVVRLTASTADEQRTAAAQTMGAAAVVGLLSGLAIGAVAILAGPTTGRILGAIALGMPGFLAQDSYRYVLFVAGRARAAAINDFVWLFTEFVIVALLYATGHATTTTVVTAFGVGATVAAFVGVWQTKTVPAPRSSFRWVRDHRDLAVPYLLELITVTGMVQVALLLIAAIAGATAIGALRAAMLLLGPLTVLFLGVLVIGVPEAIRVRERSPSALPRMVLMLGITMPVVTGILATVIMLLPPRAGMILLRSNWVPGRRVLPWVAVLIAGQSCALAAIVGLRALGAARRSLGARLWGAPIFLAGGVLGAWIDSAVGASIGLGVAAWIDALLVWTAFRREMHLSTGHPIASRGQHASGDSD